MVDKHYTTVFWILSINFLIIFPRLPSINTSVKAFEVLQTAVLPQFDLIKDREGILSPQDFQFTKIPVMRVTGGTNRWHIFSDECLPPASLVCT